MEVNVKKIDIGTICAFILTAYSATIATLILLDNSDIMFNILWPMSGMLMGCGGIVVACNVRSEGINRKICIALAIISAISAGICGINFLACVVCWLPWLTL